MTAAEHRAALNVHDDAQCLSYGVQKGSQPYVDCRMQLERNRAAYAIASRPVRVNVNGAGSGSGGGFFGGMASGMADQ